MKEGLLVEVVSVNNRHRATARYGWETSKGEKRLDKMKGVLKIQFSIVSKEEATQKLLDYCKTQKPNMPILNEAELCLPIK